MLVRKQGMECGIRRMKHEMKNHLTNIRGLFESGNFGEMEQYIKRMDGSMEAEK